MYRLSQSSVERLPHTGVFASAVRALRRLSHYNYRGYTLPDYKPSVSTNFEANYSVLFANVDPASVQIPMLSQLQMTDYAGIRAVFGPITAETGGAYYSYPASVIDTSYFESMAASFESSPTWISNPIGADMTIRARDNLTISILEAA
jgi:hypothetical protein